MNIALVCNEYPLRPHAGIGTMVQTLARALCEQGHAVTVVGLGDEDRSENDGLVKVITLKRNRTRYLGNYFSRKKLHRWLERKALSKEIDIIEVPDSQGLLPFRFDACPVVVRLHLSYAAVGRLTKETVGKGIAYYEHRTLKAHRNWIAVSRYVQDLTVETFGISASQSTVIPNAVSSGLTDSISPPPFALPAEFVMFAGHVSYRKGADVLAQAMRTVMTKRPNLHLVYAGGIFTEKGQLVSDDILHLVGPELKERVHFLGRIPRGQTLYCMSKAKVFAFPSRLESFGLVVVEAMSCGVPVVFSKHGPGAEIVDDGETGLLADPSSVSDIQTKIETLLDDVVLAKRLVAAAYKKIETKFSAVECAARSEEFYRSILLNR